MDPDWGAWSTPICEAWSSRSLVAFPMRSDREITSVVVFGKRESHPFTPVQVKLLWALALQAEIHLLRSDSGKTLSVYSYFDPLTHLYNRRYFDHQLEKEILRCRRNGGSFSLLMLDIDDFKSYNDRFMTTAGDIALQEFAGILTGSVREVDTVSRLGGDEFGITPSGREPRKGRKPWRSASPSGSSGTCCRGKRNPAPNGCRSARVTRPFPPTRSTRPTW